MPFKTLNSKSIFYTDTRSTSASPTTNPHTTLFIHGLGSSSCFYSTIIPYLTSQTRCVALDTPGSGLSSLGTQEQTIQTIAEDALALLDALDVNEKVIVVGHSMGGIVASEIAARFKERVKGVILLGPVNPAEGLKEVFGKRVEIVKAEGLEPLANTIPTLATGSKSTSLHHAFIRSLILGTTPAGYISLCNAIANATKPDYASIDVPLLILAGEDDKTAPLAGAEAIAREYGTKGGEKKVEVFRGVGHWHCVEAGEEVGRLVGGFLGRL
ncbi:3-oxoadipate enol-lactone hydrolase-like protein [Rhexocercosporidium sp. MPI-PUGE-AT-0058]|nr:3-oxoadipate enol-lactone hydrolase-like protein [Rhexocercosporidium sp. MPI-PUGE-AT-0058]